MTRGAEHFRRHRLTDRGPRASGGTACEKTGFLIEATLRQRLIHRGTRVDAWAGSLLSIEMTAASGQRSRCGNSSL
jgi:hypothetical protein